MHVKPAEAMATKQRRLRQLRRDDSGLALVEFAFAAPLLLIIITGGAELANYFITSMRISALALQVADNASRIGEGDPLAAKKISESQINDLLVGATMQGGGLNIGGTYSEKQAAGAALTKKKARIIISSLEPDTANPGKNFIRWQRCYGQATEYTPKYGTVGTSSGSNMTGMGPAGRQAFAPTGTGVIFVEVHYRYEPLFPIVRAGMFGAMSYRDMDTVAAMIVRDDRDFSQITQDATPSSC